MLLQDVQSSVAPTHALAGTAAQWLWVVPLLPLAGFVINGALAVIGASHLGPEHPNLGGVASLALGDVDAGHRPADIVVHALLPRRPAGRPACRYPGPILAHGMAGWEGTPADSRAGAGEGIYGLPFLSVPLDTMTCPSSAECPR